ncbi:uncharacterized protein LOC132053691 [Lycium ferocissimum]|uniref:uncharacterized protein LOC132053691 n=1 Tax=Lycium ferocissimum TaxID=112874 RepID=UPI002815CD71|nr:uncharacterized protein LOC132053691 [Lycium ferocissimum]
MEEAPNLRYSIHPGAMKMYRDLKQRYWWCSMKRDIVKFVSRCLNCQQVKYEHQKLGGISQRMPIPEWKWERIAMDFLVGLPRLWMIYTFEKLAKIYIREILYLHGLPVSIISDRQTQFTFYFWKYLQKELGTRVELSTTFHPQIDGQSERIIQVLLKASPMKGVLRFVKKGKLSPRCIGPFEIIQSVRDVVYELALPHGLSSVYLVFHVSMLKEYISDGSHVIRWDLVMLDQNLSYEEEPIAILDRQIRKLRSKEIASVKVQWRGRPVEEATWETELDMRARCEQGTAPAGANMREGVHKSKGLLGWLGPLLGRISCRLETEDNKAGDRGSPCFTPPVEWKSPCD